MTDQEPPGKRKGWQRREESQGPSVGPFKTQGPPSTLESPVEGLLEGSAFFIPRPDLQDLSSLKV